MKIILAPFRELVRRRLWPVALLLIAAAIAAPMLLADKSETGATAAATPGALGDEPFLGDPIVAAGGGESTGRRRVLGAPKDPFKPTGERPEPVKDDKPASSGGETKAPSSGGGPKGDGSPGAAPADPVEPGPSAPAPTATPDPVVPSLEVSSLKVLVDGQDRILPRLAPLPDADNPAVIYLGLLEDGKTAVFLLDEGVEADGDGVCHPSPSDCQRLYMKKSDTEFFDVTGLADATEGEAAVQEFQLDVVRISTKKVASTDEARASYARSSAAGRRALRSRTDRAGRLRFDARTGKLHRLSYSAWRASVARTSVGTASGW